VEESQVKIKGPFTGASVLADKLKAFWSCVQAGGHDFTEGVICRRCGASKDGKSLAEILAEKGSKP
jgi:hypothetical protein